jgi:hypothetical protein
MEHYGCGGGMHCGKGKGSGEVAEDLSHMLHRHCAFRLCGQHSASQCDSFSVAALLLLMHTLSPIPSTLCMYAPSPPAGDQGRRLR